MRGNIELFNGYARQDSQYKMTCVLRNQHSTPYIEGNTNSKSSVLGALICTTPRFKLRLIPAGQSSRFIPTWFLTPQDACLKAALQRFAV